LNPDTLSLLIRPSIGRLRELGHRLFLFFILESNDLYITKLEILFYRTFLFPLKVAIQAPHFTLIYKVQTFYDGVVGHPPGICHLPLANPFNEKLRDALKESAARLGIPHHTGGKLPLKKC
jgi:hypothetical protein